MARANQKLRGRFLRLGLCMAGAIALGAPARAAQRDLEHRTAAEYGSVAADFDGDGKDDVSVKTDNGTWKIDFAGNGFGAWDERYVGYGGLDAVAVPADYDGDGAADLAVAITYLESGAHRLTWRIDFSSDGFGLWNLTRDLPAARGARAVPADYDGDGHADLSIKGDDGVWRIAYYANLFHVVIQFQERGQPGVASVPQRIGWHRELPAYGGQWADPVPADYDGDGRADLSVKDDFGYWYIDYANDGFGSWNATYTHRGDAFSRPVPADYDGDGKADLAVKQDGGTWYVDYRANGYAFWDASFPASPGARPIPANYDGVGGVELAVRPDCGAWWIRRPQATDRQHQWQEIAWTDAWRTSVTVTRADELHTHLGAGADFQGIVNIPTSAEIDLGAVPGLPLYLRSCVQLKGTRQGLDPGGVVSYGRDDTDQTVLLVAGHDVRIEGLRFRGPSRGRQHVATTADAIGIAVDTARGAGRNVLVTGNEFLHWTGAGVNVYHVFGPPLPIDHAGHISITRNYMHDSFRDGAGYGVVISSGYALVEGNLFDRNRHAVAASGSPNSGYVAWHNYVLQGGVRQCGSVGCYWNQHFDVHGTGLEHPGYGGVAGEYFEIWENTIRGEQTYSIWPFDITRPALMLRGKSTQGTVFADNVVVHDDLDAAILLKDKEGTLPDQWDEDPSDFNFFSWGNTFDTDTSGDLGVGDFDGDGLDDVFLANGTGWWYSSAGQTEWRFLQASRLRIRDLRFGRFDADARTDVFAKQGDTWQYSSAGTGPLKGLRSDAAPLSDLLLGDFDGNGLTDVLWTTGSSWYLSRDARAPYEDVGARTPRAARLRVGNFDGVIGDEVLSYENGEWSSSRYAGGVMVRSRLYTALTTDISSLVVADFDADGRDDVAQSAGSRWRWSKSGSSPWATLRSGGPSYYRDIRTALIGQFNQDGRADAIRYEILRLRLGTLSYDLTGTRFVGWDGSRDDFVHWTPDINVR